jgi:transcriptional regulator with XRE-family HTH domain
LEWSQEKLGLESGLHHDYIGRLERGSENIGVDNLVKIAKALNEEPQNFLIENYCFSNERKAPSLPVDGKMKARG